MRRAVTLFLALAFSLQIACAQTDWPMYGHDFASTRYSPLAQINASNASKLVQAWVYDSKPTPDAKPTRESKNTPLVINGVMYPITYVGKNGKQYVAITAFDQVVAFSLP